VLSRVRHALAQGIGVSTLLCAATAACTARQTVAPAQVSMLARAERVRVSGRAPIALLRPAPSGATLDTVCTVTHVDGAVREVRGDTLVLDRLGHRSAAAAAAATTTAADASVGVRSCREREDVRVVVAGRADTVTVERSSISGTRTAGAVAIAVAALVGLIAVVASAIEPIFIIE
jgi:hypothetical protein